MPDVELREGGTVLQVLYGGRAGETVGGCQQCLKARADVETLKAVELVVRDVQDAEKGQASQTLDAGQAVVL